MNAEPASKLITKTVFSANIGFAVAYALFAYDSSRHLPVNASALMGKFLEAFSGMLYRIAPLAVSMRTKAEHLRSVQLRECLFIAAMVGVAIVVYFGVSLFSGPSAASGSGFHTIAGASAIVSVPLCWLYIVHATWLVRPWEPRNFWDACGTRSALELCAAVTLLYMARNRSIRYGVVLVVLHFVWWIFAVCQLYGGCWFVALYVALPLSLVFPISGLTWLRSLHHSAATNA
jgi:hypothetical protein